MPITQKQFAEFIFAVEKAAEKYTGFKELKEFQHKVHQMDPATMDEKGLANQLANFKIVLAKAAKDSAETDIGATGASSSEAMIKLLKAHEKDIKGLVLKPDGDKQHPSGMKWKIGSKEGSLPTSTHEKGTGNKNEKAALNEIKKVLKAEGFV